MSEYPAVFNPNAYLNFMEPPLAYQYEVSRNICLTVLGAILWDMFTCFPYEIQLLKRPSVTIFAYFATRVLSVTYILLDALIRVHPVSNCSTFGHVIATIGLLSVASTYFLFLRRVQAVYWNSKAVQHTFTALWISCVGSTVLLPLSIERGSIADTGYCITTGAKLYAIAASVVYMTFETSSYLAISFRLCMTVNATANKMPSWRALFSGRGLPIVSKSLFRNGQQYYLAVIITHFLAFISAVIPSIPFLYKEAFTTIYTLVVTTMACRAFRKLHQESHDARVQETFSILRFSDMEQPTPRP